MSDIPIHPPLSPSLPLPPPSIFPLSPPSCLSLSLLPISFPSLPHSPSFQGVNMNSTQLLAQPELMQEMERRKLVLFTWGHDNNNVTNIQLQRNWGVAAVIYDWLVCCVCVCVCVVVRCLIEHGIRNVNFWPNE